MAMKREKQYDMFDVATGACTLEDYLFQRYSENDLSSTFWIEKTDEVDELRPPKPLPDGQPGTEPEIIPIQGPRADAAKRAAGLTVETQPVPAAPLPVQPSVPTVPDVAAAPPPVTAPPSADGADTLAAKPTGGQSLESFQKTDSSPPVVSGGFTSTPKPNLPTVDGSDAVSLSAAEEPAPAQPGAPSMEALLAMFHQATKEYNERAQAPGEDDPPGDVQVESC